jgi:hypothetical protein
MEVVLLETGHSKFFQHDEYLHISVSGYGLLESLLGKFWGWLLSRRQELLCRIMDAAAYIWEQSEI